MKEPVNVELLRDLAVRQQRLAQHFSQENRRRLIVALPGYLNRHLEPVAADLELAVVVIVLILRLADRSRSLFPVAVVGRLFNLRLDAYNGFCSVGEADARAAVGAGEDARLGSQWAKLRRRPAVWADWRAERQRAVQVRELRGRQERLMRRHGAVRS